MRIIGIDYGEKRVGVAVSNEEKTMAFPKAILPNDRTLLRDIKEMLQTLQAEAVVLGESRDLAGEPNPVMRQIERFKKDLERESGLPIHYEPEYMSSAAAARLNPRRPDRTVPGAREVKGYLTDAAAAALILQSYLDKLKRRS